MNPTPKIIPYVQLTPPPEPLRVGMDEGEMEKLVDSINRLGLIFPLVVVRTYLDASDRVVYEPVKGRHKDPDDCDAYEIVDGHRRWMALGRLKIAAVPCMVFDNLADAKFGVMLDANTCREDVTPFEEGVEFLDLATKHTWSMDQLMQFFGRSEDYINDRVDIVRKDQAVAKAVRDRRIGLGQAKEVLKEQDLTWRAMLLEQAAVHGATVGALREMRHQHAREVAQAQGELPRNTPAYAAPEPVISPDACLFCGRNDDVPNLVILRIHQHELMDLKAVLDKFSRRALLEQLGK